MYTKSQGRESETIRAGSTFPEIRPRPHLLCAPEYASCLSSTQLLSPKVANHHLPFGKLVDKVEKELEGSRQDRNQKGNRAGPRWEW